MMNTVAIRALSLTGVLTLGAGRFRGRQIKLLNQPRHHVVTCPSSSDVD